MLPNPATTSGPASSSMLPPVLRAGGDRPPESQVVVDERPLTMGHEDPLDELLQIMREGAGEDDHQVVDAYLMRDLEEHHVLHGEGQDDPMDIDLFQQVSGLSFGFRVDCVHLIWYWLHCRMVVLLMSYPKWRVM